VKPLELKEARAETRWAREVSKRRLKMLRECREVMRSYHKAVQRGECIIWSSRASELILAIGNER